MCQTRTNDAPAANTTSRMPRTNTYQSVSRVRTSLGRSHVIIFLLAGQIQHNARCARVSFRRVHPIFAASGLYVRRLRCPEACTGPSHSKLPGRAFLEKQRGLDVEAGPQVIQIRAM